MESSVPYELCGGADPQSAFVFCHCLFVPTGLSARSVPRTGNTKRVKTRKFLFYTYGEDLEGHEIHAHEMHTHDARLRDARL
jgi:hypothetical protein